jgi:hypothetical protein
METTFKARVCRWLLDHEPILTAVVVILLALAVVGAVEMVRP